MDLSSIERWECFLKDCINKYLKFVLHQIALQINDEYSLLVLLIGGNVNIPALLRRNLAQIFFKLQIITLKKLGPVKKVNYQVDYSTSTFAPPDLIQTRWTRGLRRLNHVGGEVLCTKWTSWISLDLVDYLIDEVTLW